jgi:hypothetical protein
LCTRHVEHADEDDEIELTINDQNRLLVQSIEDRLVNSVNYQLEGNGCALVQLGVKYNHRNVSESEGEDQFELSVQTSQQQRNQCANSKLTICYRYKGSDIASNMAIISVRMVSGWMPDKKSLAELQSNILYGIQRVENEKNTVDIYFNEIVQTRQCIELDVTQEILVSDTRPSLIHIYDYYLPETAVYVNYSLPDCTPQAPDTLISGAATTDNDGDNGGNNERRRHRNRPTDKNNRHHSRRGGSSDRCPTCTSQLNMTSDELEELLCQDDQHVYRVSVLNRNTMRLDESYTRGDSDDNRRIRYNRLHSQCDCPILDRGKTLLVVMSDEMPVHGRTRRLSLNVQRSHGLTLVELAESENQRPNVSEMMASC